MKVTFATLESMGVCEIFDQDNSMNVIDATWAFKCKRYPNGLFKTFKDRFFARGDQQLEEIDLFETYTPVVHWTKDRLMLVIETLMSLKYNQGDDDAVFLHAYIHEDDKVYVDIPRIFEQFYNN